MRRHQWEDLPEEARAAVEARYGTVREAESCDAGLTLGLASRLRTDTGRLFVKAIPTDDPTAEHYTRERAANQRLPPDVPAPRILCSTDVGGWLLLVFEHVQGREADLSPGSPDIPVALDTVARLGKALTPCPWPDAPSVADKLTFFRRRGDDLLATRPSDLTDLRQYAHAADGLDIDTVAADSLLHGDLHPANLHVTSDRVCVIDWSLACRGAPWVDTALLLPRLITAGHTPAEAEALARAIPAWHHAPPQAVTGLAATRALFAEFMSRHGPPRLRHHRARMATACKQWVRHRTGNPTKTQ